MTAGLNLDALEAAVRDGDGVARSTVVRAGRVKIPTWLSTTTVELTLVQSAVLRLAAQGLRNREIATQLRTSVPAVESTLSTIYKKLDVDTDAQHDPRVCAVLWWVTR